MTVLLAWTIPICLTLVIAGRLVDRQLDRGHEIRWHDRFYQPQSPRRTGRVIDVDVGSGSLGWTRDPTVRAKPLRARSRRTRTRRSPALERSIVR